MDDELQQLQAWKTNLTSHGYTVDTEPRSEEALTRLRAVEYDVAIVDYLLSGKRGTDIIADMKRIRPYLKTILISGQIDHDACAVDEVKALAENRVHSDRYLPKPVRVKNLIAAIEELCLARSSSNAESRLVRYAQDYVKAAKVSQQDKQRVRARIDKSLHRTRRRHR